MSEEQLMMLEEIENLLNGYVTFSPMLSTQQRADDGLEVASGALERVRQLKAELMPEDV